MNEIYLRAWDVVEERKWPHDVKNGEMIINENAVNFWQDRRGTPGVQPGKLNMSQFGWVAAAMVQQRILLTPARYSQTTC